MIIQWGRTDFSKERQAIDITLPITFSSSNFSPISNCSSVTYSGDVSYGNSGTGIVSSSKIRLTNERGTSYPERVYWLAVGY